MRVYLPLEIQTRPLLPDGVSYVLPRRQLGKLRVIGWVLNLVALAMALGAAGFVASCVPGIAGAMAARNGFNVALAASQLLFTVPFCLAAGTSFVVGMFLLRGHAEIVVTRESIEAVERWGPLRWRQVRRAEGVTVVAVCENSSSPTEEVNAAAPSGGIRVEFKDQPRVFLAPLYPLELVEPLAMKVAGQFRVALSRSDSPGWGFDTLAERLAERSKPVVHEPSQLPAGSDITTEYFADGLTIHVPPGGIRRCGKGFFSFGVVWMVVTFLITGSFIFVEAERPWFLLIFFAVFWAIGIGMMLAGINMGRRRAVLAIVDDSLMVIQTGLFGSRRAEWKRDTIGRIECGSSGMKINDVPVMELQIHPNRGKKFGMLAGRDNAELRWLAGTLWHELRLDEIQAETT